MTPAGRLRVSSAVGETAVGVAGSIDSTLMANLEEAIERAEALVMAVDTIESVTPLMLSTIERPASLCSAKPMALESTEAAYVSSASVLVGVTREDTMLTVEECCKEGLRGHCRVVPCGFIFFVLSCSLAVFLAE